MKDYKTVAEDVFRRRDEIIEENKIRRKKLAEVGISAACWAAVGAVGFGVWKTHIAGKIGNSQDILSSTEQKAPDNLLSSEIAPSDSVHSDYFDELMSRPYNHSGIPGSETSDNEYIVDGVDIRCCVPIHGGIDGPEENYTIKGHISNIDVEFEKAEYSPENGEVIIANSLKKAIEIYGAEDSHGELYYHVIIEYYKDGELVETTKDLWQSEHDRGAHLNFESYSSDWGATFEHHIWNNMTVSELESFEPSGEYGYVMHLYNAYFGYPYKLMDNIINGLYNNGIFIE